MAVSQDYMTWTPGPRLDSRFLLYVLRSCLRHELQRLMAGSTHKTIYMPDLLALRAPMPPVQVQRSIVDFLDREHERVNQLSAKCNKLARVMDDVLESWFNDQPETNDAVEVALSRALMDLSDGPFGSTLASEHYTEERAVRVVRLGNIGRAEFRDDDHAYVSEDYARARLSRSFLHPGDVIIAGLGDATHPLGRACLVPDVALPAVNKADCFRAVVRPGKADAGYVAWTLSFGATQRRIAGLARGSTRSRLNTAAIRSIRVPLPDLAEQRTLVCRAEARRVSCRAVSQRVMRLSNRLAGYRDALATEAVTGQIDVTRVSEAQMDERAHAAMEGEPVEAVR